MELTKILSKKSLDAEGKEMQETKEIQWRNDMKGNWERERQGVDEGDSKHQWVVGKTELERGIM